jgi:hypothetical protein
MGTKRIKWAGAAGAAVLGGVMMLAPAAASASTVSASSVSATVTASAVGGDTHVPWYCPPANALVNVLGIDVGLFVGLGYPDYPCP